jgi:ATP-dependent helicase/nuclease subunit A
MTTPSEFLAADEAARERLIRDLDTCLFVEAGAGTGKTTSMVDRITALVATGRGSAETLVAITFTEAAAGELRSRVRDSLETAAMAPERSETERERCGRAAERLDLAVISTIHSFAAELLRAYPLEAGCPPRLDILDPTAELVARRESFRTWFETAPDRPWGADVHRVLQLGMRVSDLEKLATGLSREWDVLSADTRWAPSTAGDVADCASQIAATLRELGDGQGLPDHPWTTALRRARLVGERCGSAADDDDCIAALRLAEALTSFGGNAPDWLRNGGSPTQGEQIRDELKRIKKDAAATLTAMRANALCAVLPHLRDWILADVAGRQRQGTPTFQDLLAWARALLLRADVRAQCRARWSHIIVDEFQDTDPLQAEFAVLLAAVPEHDPDVTAWVDARLIPGRLCVVGDPKQSIYRFRRADIALYGRLRETFLKCGGDVVTLSRNFRSTPQIIDVVNQHFARTMTPQTGVQPEYVALLPDRGDAGDCVWVMGEQVDAPAGEVWEIEAHAVASAARRIHEQAWPVGDRASGGTRAAAYGDICVLVPTRTNVRRLEQAFDALDVPYRLESGALVLETQEVRDLLSTLRAIDDPSDQVALVAALRSPAYGCSDVELHRWVTTGGRLNALHSGSGEVPRVRDALTDIAVRHGERHERSVAAIVEQLIADHMVDVAAYDERRPREVLRRLRWVANQARMIAASGLGTLRETVDLLESLEREAPRSSSGAATETDEDSVRVMTVHGAKGLEFPVVILTGLGSDPNRNTEQVLVDRLERRVEARVHVPTRTDMTFMTAGYEAAKMTETELADAERQRLMYVATTRGRDQLIVSVFRNVKRPGRDAVAFDHTLRPDGRVALARTLADEGLETSDRAAMATDARSADDDRREEEAWIAERALLIAERSTEVIRSATSIAHEPELEPPDVTAFRRGRGGTSLGRAVHAVLQFVPLEDDSSIDDLARVQATVEGIPDKVDRVAELARRAWSSEPMRRAAVSRGCWREVPVGAMLDGDLVEGFIDLLYEDADELVVADYKTDDVTGAELARRMERYRVQGEVYARLIEAVTGRRVARCEFIFAASGEVRVVTSDSGRWTSSTHSLPAVV